MSPSRARKVMLAAIAISLLLHLFLAGYIRWPFPGITNEPRVVKVREITIARAVPRTPPPATPPPTPRPTPPATPAVKPTIVPPALSSRASRGPHVAHVIPASGAPASAAPASSATPLPRPLATAAPQPCMEHDISPAVASTAAPADLPPAARASKTNGTAAITVQISPQGSITGATVLQSSGNTDLDAAALQMARGATYTPALVKCKPVASTYTFTVKFVAW